MLDSPYRGRRAVAIENDMLRVTVLLEGGHIAEIFDKETGVNPLWSPPWAPVDPTTFEPARNPEFGTADDARLLAGIMGHNICLDIFGGASPEEFAAGITAHGEGPVVTYRASESDGVLTTWATLPLAQIRFERSLELRGRALRIRETVENLSACDRPIGWTQHVTLGPPFLQKGATQFRASATRSKVFESDFGSSAYLVAGAEFEWPSAPSASLGFADLRVMSDATTSSAYTAHLMDPAREFAYFAAFSPAHRLAFGYVWKHVDFPWLGIWEENHSRTHSPWNGAGRARGMEVGVSPFPESRRAMIDRGRLFDVPTYRWVPARSRIEAVYWAIARTAESVPEALEWPE